MNLVQYTATVVKLIKLLSWPVGSIYTSTKSTDPHELFGGTWEPIQDVFLYCAGPKHAAGETGGEETHKLTVEEMPEHNHVPPDAAPGLFAGWGSVFLVMDVGNCGHTGNWRRLVDKKHGGGSRSVSCRRTRPSTLGSARLNVCAGGAC